MAIESHLTMAYAYNVDSEMEECPDDGSDQCSDTSSDMVELDNAEFPLYFQEQNGRLFHSHVDSPYPLPVDTAEQNVGNVITLPSPEFQYRHVAPIAPQLRHTDSQ